MLRWGLRRGQEMGWGGGLGAGEEKLRVAEGFEAGQRGTRTGAGMKFGAGVGDGGSGGMPIRQAEEDALGEGR